MEFEPFPKIPRLRRAITITEKIDGTNAQVCIMPSSEYVEGLTMLVGSRSRWIRPGKETDNFGFAQWCFDNSEDLFKLGVGRHYGEWWGQGIQRRYDKNCKTFSLFNTARPADTLPECVSQVPLMYHGVDEADEVQTCLNFLMKQGSLAAPSFMKPEGIVVYHTAARSRFKVLLENDDIPKGEQS
jgi:hypothetical protein